MDNIGTPRASFNPPPDSPPVEEVKARATAGTGFMGVMLPAGLVDTFVTHMGTPRLELLVASRLAYLVQRSDAAGSDAVRYYNRHTGAHTTAERIEGTAQSSIQRLAEHLYVVVERRSVPDDELDNPDFRRFYDRVRAAAGRAEAAGWIRCEGHAVPAPTKREADLNGLRWSVHPALRRAPIAPRHNDYTPCSGPEYRPDLNALHVSPWSVIRHIRAERGLGDEFTASRYCKALGSRHRTHANAEGSADWHARHGSDTPRFQTIGRYRTDEADRAGTRRACTVPWIVLELDGKGLEESLRHAAKIRERLRSYGLADEHVVYSYTGGRSVHIRVPHSAVGSPVYDSEEAAQDALTAFIDGLCAGMPDVRAAVDDACTRPGQLLRMIGTRYQAEHKVDNTGWAPVIARKLRSRPGVDSKQQALAITAKVCETLERFGLEISTHTADTDPHRALTTVLDFHGPHAARLQIPKGYQEARSNRCIRIDPAEIDTLAHTHIEERSAAQHYHGQPLPSPHTAPHTPALSRLLRGRTSTVDRSPTDSGQPLTAPHCWKATRKGGTIGRIRGGVSEGERNRSAYLMTLYLLTYGRGGPDPPWKRLQDWNQLNHPPLPSSELAGVYRSATRSRAVKSTTNKRRRAA